MSEAKRHLVTCALPYANGPIHIGHLAGCLLPSDIYVRHLRKQGKDVLFVSGTDEHGVPITLRARKEGVTPQEIVDRFHTQIRESLEQWGLQFDNFSRTSTELHKRSAQEFFTTLYNAGVFTEQTNEQYFDEEAGQFLADRYIVGTCPKCGNENAYGDQCERCGSSLSPRDLINPRSALTGNLPVLRETKNWFLPLDKLQDEFLNAFIASREGQWKAHVLGQCKSWLKDGLRPRAMTRDLDWGVPVPLPDLKDKVLYVWFDAPIGYISATREIRDDWELWWKNSETELTHFIGKDNIVFHCIIFPAMLHAHGGYIQPTHVPANEFLNLEGSKISTSRDYAVWLHEYLRDLPGRNDELRYVLTSIMPETADADFSWKDYQARVNNELVAIVGNWVNRVVVLTQKYFEGSIPEARVDEEVLQDALHWVQKAEDSTDQFRFRDAQSELLQIARLGNKYLQEQAPWMRIKEEGGLQDVRNCLYTSLKLVWTFGNAIEPFLPETSVRIKAIFGNLEPAFGMKLADLGLLFKKIEDEEIQPQVDKLAQPVIEESMEEEIQLKPAIAYDDFAKLDLRVGMITAATKVPKADKLLELKLDMGFEQRTVVSGIAEHFNPDEVIGKQVIVVANLAPRKLRGIESQGMILMAEDKDGRLEFASPLTVVGNGSIVS
ncbi:MAG: methionine--tRNA ligase [Flavobacteriales bacterium]|nr:methionine--tRNA ligase [Flavobacteriales bacterium]